METNETNKAALIALDLKDGASMAEIRFQYVDKTSSAKFQGLFILDEKLKKEFLNYHRAYLILLKHYADIADDSELNSGNYQDEHYFQTYLNQGIFYVINQEYIKAGDKFQQAYSLNNKSHTVHLYLGYLLLKRKNYYAAEKYFKDASELHPECDDAWFYLGECYLRGGDARKALVMYTKARKLNPIRTDTQPRINEINLKLGNTPSSTSSEKKDSLLVRILKKLLNKLEKK